MAKIITMRTQAHHNKQQKSQRGMNSERSRSPIRRLLVNPLPTKTTEGRQANDDDLQKKNASIVKLQAAARAFLKHIPKISPPHSPVLTIKKRGVCNARVSDITMLDFNDSMTSLDTSNIETSGELFALTESSVGVECTVGMDDVEIEEMPAPLLRGLTQRQISMATDAAVLTDRPVILPIRRESESIHTHDFSSLASYDEPVDKNESNDKDNHRATRSILLKNRMPTDLLRSTRQVSKDSDAAALADRPVSPPIRRESGASVFANDVSSLTSYGDFNSIHRNTILEDMPGPLISLNRQITSNTDHAVTTDGPIMPPLRRESGHHFSNSSSDQLNHSSTIFSSLSSSSAFSNGTTTVGEPCKGHNQERFGVPSSPNVDFPLGLSPRRQSSSRKKVDRNAIQSNIIVTAPLPPKNEVTVTRLAECPVSPSSSQLDSSARCSKGSFGGDDFKLNNILPPQPSPQERASGGRR